MKIILTILVFCITCSISLSQSKNKDIVPLSTLKQKLYIKNKTSKKKKRLKENETIELFLKNDIDSLYAKIVLWDKNGIYYSPYSKKLDSILIDSINNAYYNFNYLLHDTIIYANFDSIRQLNFKKNLSNRAGANVIILTVGVEFLVLPLILSPMSGGGYSNFGPEGFIMVGSGAILTAYAWWRLKSLQKLEQYPMDKYEFIIK